MIVLTQTSCHNRLKSLNSFSVSLLIGKDWLFSKNETGRSRLENPDDFVRLEVGTALKRNIPVTPVLVHGAQIPSADQLPEDLKDLSYRNGFELASTAGSPTFRR
jgi:hypothetical protein